MPEYVDANSVKLARIDPSTGLPFAEQLTINRACPVGCPGNSSNLILNGKPVSEERFNQVMSDWSKESVASVINGLKGGTISVKLPFEHLVENIGK